MRLIVGVTQDECCLGQLQDTAASLLCEALHWKEAQNAQKFRPIDQHLIEHEKSSPQRLISLIRMIGPIIE
jgi:hypothetical protein